MSRLAPEQRHLDLSPLLPDAGYYPNEMLASHTVVNARFSRQQQYTIFHWRQAPSDKFTACVRAAKEDAAWSERFARFCQQNRPTPFVRSVFTLDSLDLFVAPVEGDIDYVSVVTAPFGTVLVAGSPAATWCSALQDVITSRFTTDRNAPDLYYLLGCLIDSVVRAASLRLRTGPTKLTTSGRTLFASAAQNCSEWPPSGPSLMILLPYLLAPHTASAQAVTGQTGARRTRPGAAADTDRVPIGYVGTKHPCMAAMLVPPRPFPTPRLRHAPTL